MSSITENLRAPGHSQDKAQVTNILVRAGAQFVDDAIRDNPDGPVTRRTEISRAKITYEMMIGCPGNSLSPRAARYIWRRAVTFGRTNQHCAGGTAFIETARQQEAVAWVALDLLEARQ
jgi:hypothetical protein